MKLLFKYFILKLLNFKFALVGVVSTHVIEPSTVVELTDDELFALLEPFLNEIDGNVISAALLQSLGFLTPTVISLLEGMGNIIQ